MTLCSCRLAPEPDGSLVNTGCCTLSPKFQVHLAWETHIQKYQLSNDVSEHKFLSPTHSETKQIKMSDFGSEKSLLKAIHGIGSLVPKKNPVSWKGFKKTFLKAKWGRGVVGCCKVLSGGILCSCSYPPRSGQDVPGNPQQDNVTLCSAPFLSLYERNPKSQGFKNGLPVYFRV